ncbi:MAG: lytic transglycosylase F [Marinilabiliales bacterium]|nr:MAG: lytic transglycosylase F [Marinilabiliales bacterium]
MGRKKVNTFFSFLAPLVLMTLACDGPPVTDEEAIIPHYTERGRITAITDYNSTNYFIYRGEPMGYQYEMLNLLADHLGVRLDVVVNNNLDESFSCLMGDECDLIAMNLTVTRERSRMFDFTVPHSQTRQVLVQRLPSDWHYMTAAELDTHMVRSPLELAGKTVHVQKNSAYASRLRNLMDEIGDTILIKEVDIAVEQLITMVAEGEIDITVGDENVARVNQTYYQNLDIGTAISFTQNLAWAVRKGDYTLRDSINEWLRNFSSTIEYRLLYAKYFRNQRSARIIQSDFYVLTSGRISPYDDLIRKYSEEIGWDWRLLASMIYQESRFRYDAESWAGARGLMQLMPGTARRYGVRNLDDPEENIRGGVRYIAWLDEILSDRITDREERIKFILASYNVGLGHVLDARALARKYDKDPDRWTGSVDYYILNKSNPDYFLDPVVRHGYARGYEPYRYVGEILNRYDHYRNIVTDHLAQQNPPAP